MVSERIIPKGIAKLKDERIWDGAFEDGLPEDEDTAEEMESLEDFEEDADVLPEDEESDELYEKYMEIMDQEEEDDEDDIAAVAERITGERHSRVTTAAPVRIRAREEVPVVPPAEEPPKPEEPEQPEYLELPKRDLTAISAEPAEEDYGDEPAVIGISRKKQAVTAVIVAAILLLLLGAGALTVGLMLNREENPEQPNDFPIGTELQIPDKTDDPVETDEETEPETEEPETEPPVEETEPPVETEPETEPPVETEPPLPTYNVTLDFYDRDDITTTVTQMTLAQVYQAVGYTPRESDRPSVSLDYMIAADAYINIDTATYASENVTVAVPYGSDVIEVDTIPRGDVNYISYGQNGEAVQTYTVEYLNGKEVKRTLASEKTTKWPVNETYEIGVGGTFVGEDGVTYTYSHRRVVPATYYSLEGLTYLGTQADERVIAVDPDNIPLGTKLYVKNDQYDFGVRIASDTGPKVDKWQIDIWLSIWNPQYDSFAKVGYHDDMEIYYID